MNDEPDDEEEWLGWVFDAVIDAGVPLWLCLVATVVLARVWVASALTVFVAPIQ